MPDEIPAKTPVDTAAAPALKAPRTRGGIKKIPRLGIRKELPAPDPEPAPTRPVLVEFKEMSKVYHGHLALDKISLKLYKGEFLSLVGPSGAGKSTLIKCLTLQLKPDSGRIIVAGRDITLMRDREMPYYRRKVGVVFQDFKLLPSMTVGENVAFALEVSDVSRKDLRCHYD